VSSTARTRKPGTAILVIAVLGLVLGAALGGCGGGGDEKAETVTVTEPGGRTTAAEEPPAEEEASAGKAAYLAAGCDACHGEDAKGTDVGPPLPGHTVAQVRQQVRRPLGQMPASLPEQLPDEDLDKIAGYIAGLEATEEHVEPVKLSEVVAIHHWMAIGAIAADDRNDAIHHVGHITESVRGEHLRAMKRARTLLRAGEMHEAEHLVEEMLAGKAKPELTLPQLSLRLALTAVDQRDRSEAIHQMRHFRQTAKGARRAKGEEILDHMRERDMHGAEHGIAELLGIERK
jgi:mono/diheme cytochrome c family protein